MEKNGEPLCKVMKFDTHPFQMLKEPCVLNELKDKKSVFIHAKVEPGNKDAVVILEKKPFDTSQKSLESLLSDGTQLVQDISNDIYRTYDATPQSHHSNLKTTLIYPATQKHIDKYRKQDVEVWVLNILEKKTESERIVFEDNHSENGFILLPDMKWDITDPLSMHLIALVHNRNIKSLRDLDSSRLPLLRDILSKGQEAIFKRYSIPKEKLRIYVHYQPSYYHFHVHFTHIDFDAPGTSVTRAHLLRDIIENIEMAADYYQKKTLTFVGRKDDKLTISLKKPS